MVNTQLVSIRLGGIDPLTLNDTDGIAASIFFQGCPFMCKGCHNPELQSFEGGEETTTSHVINKIKEHIGWYDSIAFMGGEPLEQPEALTDLLLQAKALGLRRWLYTGYTLKNVPDDIKNLCSVIVAGRYIDDLKTGGFPASSNQQIYKGDGI